MQIETVTKSTIKLTPQDVQDAVSEHIARHFPGTTLESFYVVVDDEIESDFIEAGEMFLAEVKIA